MEIIPKGQEPERIKNRMDVLFSKLDEAYPDKVIVSLRKEHKKWSETVTELYRALGYSDGTSFLEAYGYHVKKVAAGGPQTGRPRTVDPNEIIRALQAKYPDGSPFTSLDKLFAANPEYAPNLKTIFNVSNQVFGMPLGKYLRSIGLLKTRSVEPRESIRPKKQNYYLCTVAPIDGFQGLSFLSETGRIHRGHYVEVSLWNHLNTYGIVTDVVTCTDETVPSDVKEIGYMKEKVGVVKYEANFLRNILSINAAIKTQCLQKTEFANILAQNAPTVPDDSAHVKWACCRGLVIEILRVMDDLVEREKQAYEYSDIMLITDTEAELHIFCADINDVLTRYPSLKVAMFAVDGEKEKVSLWYSKSGYSYITDQVAVGAYNEKDDWTLKHAPSENEFSIPSGKYVFPFADDWNQVNYICDTITGSKVQVKEMEQ